MSASQTMIIAVTNQKGGVGKTTTAVHLADALARKGAKTLLVDMDPQGNASQSLGFKIQDHTTTIAELLWDRAVPTEAAIVQRGYLYTILANQNLARVERGMVTMTNSELRLAHRLKALSGHYAFIIIDSAPSFGPLLNSVLNAANHLIVPVDCNYFALMGIQKLLGEIDEIRTGFNPRLNILGFLMTMVDRTLIANQTGESVIQNFGKQAFSTRIRRAVALREAPALGQTLFEYDPTAGAAQDYVDLAQEVVGRLVAYEDETSLRLVSQLEGRA